MMLRSFSLAFAVLMLATAPAAHAKRLAPPLYAGERPPPLRDWKDLEGADRISPELSAAEILARAHRAMGGPQWVRPGALRLTGYNIIQTPAGPVIWDDYQMIREFGDAKTAAHNASGKVRIEARMSGEIALLLTFDGVHTYNQHGRLEDTSANETWANSFGFGAIRHGLDEGWAQSRKPDRLIAGEPAHMIELTDPSGKTTLFGIRSADSRVVYVGFNTPRGWHERYYAQFFSKPGEDWVQAGRVTLVYNGVVANEAIWTDFETGGDYPDALFRVEAPDTPH